MMDKETKDRMVKECFELVRQKLSKKLSPEEYYASLIELHRKYPMNGHNPPLTPFQLKNYRSLQLVLKDPATGLQYLEHLYPFNFQEAAEMFIRHEQKMKEERLPIHAWRSTYWPASLNPKQLKEEEHQGKGDKGGIDKGELI
jgi:hypothetical protein